ncbi:NLP3 protein [Colletotrichum tabaci]|uniref:NLP3 protein n=1 Tax=Colletotrichum tabaci TaxID=1209068 RepID=A0AAV9TJJ9_9PEZI
MKFFALLTPLLLFIGGAAAHARYCLCAADGKGEDQATRRVCNRYIEGVLKMNDGGSVHLGKTSDGLSHDLCVGDTEDAFIWEDFERQCQDIGKVASLNCWTDDD